MFRALADPTGRSLLDELFRHVGRTLRALEIDPPRRLVQTMRALWSDA